MSSDFLSVELIDSMGDDLTVVNAARVSFGKRVSEFDDLKDGKLISYLAKKTRIQKVKYSVFNSTNIFINR